MTEHRQIIVTGASSGIGAALVEALGADECSLYICARRTDRLKEVARNPKVVVSEPCDVSNEEQVGRFIARIRDATPWVDALINCAGGFGAIGPVMETNSVEWFRTIEVNLRSVYLMSKYVIPLMLPRRGPRILNFAGGGAFDPFPNYSAYAVSKAAVVRLTETLAVELADRGISINAIAPGFVATEIHRATLEAGPERAGAEHFQTTTKRLRDGAVPMERVVDCARFLLSDRAKSLTGKTISASFDPWDRPEFTELIDQVNRSELYTLRRINLRNMTKDPLASVLAVVSKERLGGGKSEVSSS